VIATVLVPTWNSEGTLAGSVRSALRQTLVDIEVLIVGDGVVAGTRRVVEELLAEDSRVRFLDLPKAEGRGEQNRDRGVREAATDAIVYLADDDLLMPRHVENVVAGLASAPLVQSRNGYIDIYDRLRLFPTDLSDPRWPEWHLLEPQRNRVSLTGTAHSRGAYLALPNGWAVPPEDGWADLHLWRTFFREPGFRGLTLSELTTIQFPANLHRHRRPTHFAASFARWEAFTREPGAHERLQQMADEAAARQLIELSAAHTDLSYEIKAANRQLKLLESEAIEAHAALVAAQARIAELEGIVDDYRTSGSWRVTAPLRTVGGAVRRLGRRRGEQLG
jgi:hypothetical protein